MHCNYSSTFFEEQVSLFLHFTRLRWVKSCLTMFFYTADFTSSVFFPSIFPMTEIVSEFLPQRNEVKNTPQMQCCWLVALPFCNNQFFHAVACKREYFLCCIARRDNIESIFFCHIARMLATSRHRNMQTVDCKKQWQRWACFLCHIAMSEQQGLQFLHCIVREQAMTEILLYCKGVSICPIVREQARPRDSCEGMAMMAHHASIIFLYAVDCNDHGNKLEL